MGVGIGYKNSSYGSSSSSYTAPNPNPDPKNYQIIRAEEINGYLVIEIKYPNCTNYEGSKIMVYECTLIELVNQKVIDPHFFQHKMEKSPIARFVPTNQGWDMAKKLVSVLKKR